MKDDRRWYTLDNQATIYPAISDAKNTNVFRLSCVLTQPVVPELLQQALEETLLSFPYYLMILRRGLFWYYLEPTTIVPKVVQESQRPCREIFHPSKKDLLFEVSYFGDRINIEMFHALSDGGGALEMFRVLVYRYLVMVHKKELPETLVLDRAVSPVAMAEDGFEKHYTPGEFKIPKGEKAFTLGGTILPMNNISVITATMPLKQVLGVAKEAGVTLTAYLTALMIYGIYVEMMPTRYRNKSVTLTVPVDLRTTFPTQTFRNFFSVVEIRYQFDREPADFESVLGSVVEQMKEKITPDALAQSLSHNMSMQQNVFARAVPLFIKNWVLKFFYWKNEATSTATLSNVGSIAMPKELMPYIVSFHCLLNPTSNHRVKLCLNSFGDKMLLNFTGKIFETGLQQYFLRHLAEKGVEITLESNGSETK